MRVFGELSFYILITCLASIVNKQVQAIGDSENKENEGNEQVAGQSSTTGIEANAHGTGTSQSEQLVESLSAWMNTSDDDTTDEEAKEFFDSYARPQPPRISKIEFYQKLDHFNKFDDRMWIQRAYLDSQYERDDGPVLLKVGGLLPILPNELEDPALVLLAKKFHASIYILEHRYYGESVPTDLSTENLEYIRSEQVLADIERFIKESKRATRKWIVFGIEYGGSLAAWFRLKYPHVASGALVSIAPLYAITEDEDIYEIFELIYGKLKKTLQEGFDQIRKAIKSNEYNELKTKFNMCTNLDDGNYNDNVNFMYWSILQYLKSNIFKNPWEMIRESIQNPLGILASVVKRLNKEKCFSVNYGDAINKYKDLNIKYENEIDYPISLKIGLGSRPNFYQRCTEYGMFATSKKLHAFGVDVHLDFYTKLCEQVFDRKFDSNIYGKAIDTTNMLYGGQHIAATNLIYITTDNEFMKSIGMAESKVNKLIIIDDKATDITMKLEYDCIVAKLNEWTRKISKVNDNDAGGANEKVVETV